MRLFIVGLTLFFSFSTVFAAEDVESIRIKDNIHVLISPSGGNVTVFTGDDGTFLIDDQLKDRSQIIQVAVREIKNQDIKFILNTHYHFDHSGGNEFFGQKDAVIVAHENVRERLSARQFITFFQKEMMPLSSAGLPTVTFGHEMTLHYNEDTIRFVHTPAAHTDGDVVVYFNQADVLVAGDLVFSGMYPFIDIEHGGSIQGLIDGLDVLLGLAGRKTVVIPGHGPLMDKKDLRTYRKALSSILDNVETAIAQNKTLEQTINEKPTQKFDQHLGDGFIQPHTFVTIVYNSLISSK